MTYQTSYTNCGPGALVRRRAVGGLAALWALAAAVSTGCAGPEATSQPEHRSHRGAAISGVEGTTFALTARAGLVSSADGASLYSWGYALDGGLMQYPGPTLIVQQGQEITITLGNELPLPVSIVFPGQEVTATGGDAGVLTQEAAPGGSVTYRFRAREAGTYLYHSGTRPELQVEMGLVGALIVRPLLGHGFAYNSAATRFDREYLFLLTEMDPRVHLAAARGQYDALDHSDFWPVYWFINGRSAPDTMEADGVGQLPYQPYGAMVHMEPGEKVLMRVISAGRDLHPFHHHGNHARVIAQDGRLLESAPGLGPDLGYEVFTIQAVPGSTTDAIFEWTGAKLGWDAYGDLETHPHDCMDMDGDLFDDATSEYCPDHGKPIPVGLPSNTNMTFGGNWSGSPYLGGGELLPPGEGGLNPTGAFVFMWHSHTEKEMVNNDLFPGGMMTMLFIEPPGTLGMGMH